MACQDNNTMSRLVRNAFTLEDRLSIYTISYMSYAIAFYNSVCLVTQLLAYQACFFLLFTSVRKSFLVYCVGQKSRKGRSFGSIDHNKIT
jgi:hypothetical protein